MKKLVTMILCISLMVSLVACGSGGTDTAGPTKEVSENKTTLTVSIPTDPGTFYPYYMLSGVGRALYTPVYESLFIYGEDTTPEACLVDSYEIDDDGMGITLNLLHGVLFHDGTEMKANDVIFSINCLRDSNWATNIGDINMDASYAVDDYTVYLKYNSVQGPLLYMLCNVYVISESYMSSINEDDWTYNCIGTGSYKWGEYSAGSEYHLAKFHGYRDEKSLEEIIIKIIPESSVQAIELETGSVDLAMGISWGDIASYLEDESNGFTATYGAAIASFAMTASLASSPMDDPNVRLAFAHSINLDSVNSVVFSGQATPATNIYAYGIDAWKEADNQHSYNPEYAKQLLKEAGYADGVTIDLYALNTTVGSQAAEIIVGSCAEAGITVNVISCDSSTLLSYMTTGAPGFYLQTLYTNGDPYLMLNSFVSSFYAEYLGYKNDDEYANVASMYTDALSIIDSEARNEVYREIMQCAYDRCYTISLADLSDVGVHSKSLKGFWMGGPAYHYEDCYWE